MSHFNKLARGARQGRESYGRSPPPQEFKRREPSRADRGVEYIYGVQSVIGALASKKRQIFTLWMKNEISNSLDRFV